MEVGWQYISISMIINQIEEKQNQNKTNLLGKCSLKCSNLDQSSRQSGYIWVHCTCEDDYWITNHKLYIIIIL